MIPSPDLHVLGRVMILLLLLLFILIFATPAGWVGYRRWGCYGGGGVSLGAILLIVLVVYLVGGFR